MFGVLRTTTASVSLIRYGGTICRSIRKPIQESRRQGSQGPPQYRDVRLEGDNPEFWEKYSDGLLAFFWYFMGLSAYYTSRPIGFHAALDPCRFTDEELGIPPDDYDEGEPFPNISKDEALSVNPKMHYPHYPDYPVMERPTNWFLLQRPQHIRYHYHKLNEEKMKAKQILEEEES